MAHGASLRGGAATVVGCCSCYAADKAAWELQHLPLDRNRHWNLAMPLCFPASRVPCSLVCHAAPPSNLTRAARCCEFFVAWTALPMRFCVHLCWLTFTPTVATSLKLQLHASNGQLTQGRGEAEAALQPHSSSAFALTRFKRCCWGGSEGPVPAVLAWLMPTLSGGGGQQQSASTGRHAQALGGVACDGHLGSPQASGHCRVTGSGMRMGAQG